MITAHRVTPEGLTRLDLGSPTRGPHRKIQTGDSIWRKCVTLINGADDGQNA